MNSPTAASAVSELEHQLDLLSQSADVASRSLERIVSTQFDGCRDWLKAVSRESEPSDRLESHFDQTLQLSCALFVAQVSAVTDAMQVVEKAIADQHRQLLGRLGEQLGGSDSPLKQALCVSGCSYDAMSKATRQVANFASNRFAAAAVSAFQQARDKMAESI